MANNDKKDDHALGMVDTSISGFSHISDFLQNTEDFSTTSNTSDSSITKTNPDNELWEPVIGTIFDSKYKIEEKLGEGGMGVVYRATHIFIDRPVAIKFLRKEYLADTAAVDRFKLEARAAARINHPNVTSILDFGLTEGTFYLVMEYLEGYSLRQQLKNNGALSVKDTVKIATQVCEALEAAHKSNIIHKDLKPDNIFIHIKEGIEQVKVLDFGIAEILGRSSDNPDDYSTLAGTPHYMSPEQCQNDPVGPTADIYSLGVILFELLTGHLPFDDPSMIGIILKHLSSPPPKLTDIKSDIPIEFEAIVSKALAKNPEKRYQSSSQLLQDLLQAESAALNLVPNISTNQGEPTVLCSNPKCAQVVLVGSRRCPRCEALSVGTLLRHRYLIEKMVGKGGFGTTYLVKDVDCFDEHRILKELSLNVKVEDPEELKDMGERLFKREAQVLLNLHHSGIPRLYAYFSEEDFSYLVQDFIPGQTLSEELKKRKVAYSQEEAIVVLSTVADILDYLHSHNPPIIHRDIKPHNLMRHQDGRIMLIDFGAVCHAVANPEANNTVIGSLGYAPPEQFLGQTLPQSDLYALGASTIYLLTGIPPKLLLSNSFDKLDKELNGKIRPELYTILKDLVNPDIRNRLPDTATLKKRLQELTNPVRKSHTPVNMSALSASNTDDDNSNSTPSLVSAFAKTTGALPSLGSIMVAPQSSQITPIPTLQTVKPKTEESPITPRASVISEASISEKTPPSLTKPSAPSLANLLTTKSHAAIPKSVSNPLNTNVAPPTTSQSPSTTNPNIANPTAIDFQAAAQFYYEVENMLRTMDFATYFAILGISSDASKEQIISAYRELSDKFNPTRYFHLASYNPNLSTDLKKISSRLLEAFETLMDQNKRNMYQRSFRTGTFEKLK